MSYVDKGYIKLVNVYTGDVVLTKNYNDIKESDGKKFITAFYENNPNRTFLVNRDAYKRAI